MLSFDDAKSRIAKLPLPLNVETIPIWDAFGRFLAEDIDAVQDLPAWNNSGWMDMHSVMKIISASESHPVSLPLQWCCSSRRYRYTSLDTKHLHTHFNWSANTTWGRCRYHAREHNDNGRPSHHYQVSQTME